MKRRSLDDWLAYISAQHPSAIALGLERVREVANRMQIVAPAQAGAQFVVGGTNGKGSTCAYLERILLEAGYKTALYTSPHLIRYNERVRVGGEEVSDEALVASFERVEAARGDTPLTYFEYGTLAALWLFADAKVEAVILEVGLGGRLDAVNIVDADCSIVASVDLDHQAWLGNDREAIGFEKAGIFRPGRPALFGDFEPPRRLVEQAQTIGAQLQVLGRDFRYEVVTPTPALPQGGGSQWDFVGRRGAKRSLPMPALRGAWQLKNAATALAALDELSERLPVSIGEIKRGLALVRLLGRLQVLPGRPSIVLDVAHNPQAARALAEGLGEMGFHENTIAVFGVLADKDVAGIVDAVRHRIDRWHVAAPPSERAASAAAVASVLAERGLQDSTRTFVTVESALEAARREAGANDRIVVFGSFYTVAEALRSVR